MADPATWNLKYWDLAEQFFWAPQYIGMRSIPQRLWRTDGDSVSVPRELVNKDGPLYARARTAKEHGDWMRSQEEILNHVFDITFAISPTMVLERCFLRPLGLRDDGPFESLGREIRERYGWSASENVTQQDGLFVSPGSIIGVELKLGATSSPIQIVKYAALMAWEELHSGPHSNLGLLYILDEEDLDRHWRKCGLQAAAVDGSLLNKVDRSKLPRRIQHLLDTSVGAIGSVLDRMILAAITWADLTQSINAISADLDPTRPGDQTLINLLRGFTNQVAQQTRPGGAL